MIDQLNNRQTDATSVGKFEYIRQINSANRVGPSNMGELWAGWLGRAGNISAGGPPGSYIVYALKTIKN
jgi:hypothetical protein